MPNKATSLSSSSSTATDNGSPLATKRRNPYTANQPQDATPPVPGYRAFYYRIQPGMTHTLTPGGTAQDSREHQGSAHQHIRSPEGTTYIEGEFLRQTTPRGRFGALIAELKCLKARVDKDYRSPSLDRGHYRYAQSQIDNCIVWTKRVVAENRSSLDDLNRAIEEGTLYNPFGLSPIYQGANYDEVAAENISAFTSAITDVQLSGNYHSMNSLVISFSMFDDTTSHVEEVHERKKTRREENKPQSKSIRIS